MNQHDDPLRPHRHDPNFVPPSDDPAIQLVLPDGQLLRLTPPDLALLPQTSVPDCYIVSTSHGTSGPFVFAGVRLLDLLLHYLPAPTQWFELEVLSADGFGTRISAAELQNPAITRPLLLCFLIDGRPLTRAEGLVRLIVPSETDDALRQVKWVSRINVR